MALEQFSDTLTAARNAARRSGRSLSTQETAGITAGFASTAAERLARAKQVANQTRMTDVAVEDFNLRKPYIQPMASQQLDLLSNQNTTMEHERVWNQAQSTYMRSGAGEKSFDWGDAALALGGKALGAAAGGFAGAWGASLFV